MSKSITLKLLLVNGIIMLAFAAFFFYQTYSRTDRRILDIVHQQASLALQFNLSIRQYARDHIRPAMYEQIKENEFFPETMSTSYISRSIFEGVRKQFPDYIIKFSSENPRNPVNLAGAEELEIIRKFEADPGLEHWEGRITIEGKAYLARFSARKMTASCLGCHGDPSDAPASLIEIYGNEAGFHRKPGDILGLDTIAIPMTHIISERHSEFFAIALYSGLGFILFLSLSMLMARHLIVKRLSLISKHFLDIAWEKDARQIEPIHIRGRDEISDLAVSFNKMSDRLKKSYEFLNQQVEKRTRELENEIRDHERSEEYLKQSEEKFRTAFKASPNVITLTSLENGTYVDINDAFTNLLGYTQKEIIGKSAIEMNIWNDPKDRERLVKGLKEKGRVENLEADFKGKDGQVIKGSMTACRLTLDNSPHLISVTQDLTDIRKSEQERLNLEIRLQQAQKVEAIGTLAGGIAHDFNNILSGIFGYSQLAEMHLDDKQRARSYIRKIVEGGQRASSLIQQILTFSRQTQFTKQVLKLDPVLKEALALIRSTIPANIEIRETCDSRSAILGDPTQIHQVVMNLCTNAYHAMGDEGGVLSVTSEEIDITQGGKISNPACHPGKYVRLEVSDTGSGIEKKIIDKIFDPYFTTKEAGKGTGLGLAVVNAIVKEHNGFLELNTNPGEGTTFQVYLPVIEESGLIPKNEEKEVNSVSPASGRIMVVDDEPCILDSLEAIFSDQGYHVSTFSNGPSALKEFSAGPDNYDLIITDMTMPKMTGDKLSRELLKIRKDISIILCTGYHESFTKKDALRAGIKRYVYKPIDSLAFLKIIRELIGMGKA